jgi:MFS family permease
MRQLTALYVALYLVNFHHMSMSSLVNYFGDVHGMSRTTLGIITSGTYLGFFLGCYLFVPLLRRVSYIRTFAVSSAATAICALLVSLTADPILWLVFRVMSGAFIGISQVIGESWLAEVVEKKTKGLLYGIYYGVVYIGLASSQLLLYFGEDGMQISMTLSVITALLALLPICLTKFSEPSFNQENRLMTITECYRISRLSCIGIVMVGICLSSSSLIVTFARGMELNLDRIVLLSSVMFVSSIAFHMPVGYLSDRLGDRRHTLMLVCGAVAPVALLAGIAGPYIPFPALLLLVFVYAGLAPTIYPLCMALGTDLVSKENITPFVGRIFQLYFIGGITGPLVIGALMETFSDIWLFVAPSLVLGGFFLLCASSQFMPKFRPLTTGPYIGSGALAGMGGGTSEHMQMQTMDKENLFVGPPSPEPEEFAAVEEMAEGPEAPVARSGQDTEHPRGRNNDAD